MHILVNGERHNLDKPISLSDLLLNLDMKGKRVAIELNQHIIPHSQHSETVLQDGDVIEIIQAIAGG